MTSRGPFQPKTFYDSIISKKSVLPPFCASKELSLLDFKMVLCWYSVYVLVSLIAVARKKSSPYPDLAAFWMSVSIHKTRLLRLCKVCGWVGVYICSRNVEGGRTQVSVTLEK